MGIKKHLQSCVLSLGGMSAALGLLKITEGVYNG